MAPISWGVTATAGWGFQFSAGRVLEEARRLGVWAFEAGPEGFIPVQPGLRIVAGSSPGFLHRNQLPGADRQARQLESAGAELLVVSPGEEAFDARGWASFFDALGALDAICRRHRLRLAVEPRFDSAIDSQARLEQFLVGCHHALCIDTGELMLCGIDPIEVVDFDPARIAHVHLKDLEAGLAGAVRQRLVSRWEATFKGLIRPLGEGDAEISGLMAALERHGYPGWLVLEQDVVLAVEPPPGEGPYQGLRRSLEFLGLPPP